MDSSSIGARRPLRQDATKYDVAGVLASAL